MNTSYIKKKTKHIKSFIKTVKLIRLMINVDFMVSVIRACLVFTLIHILISIFFAAVSIFWSPLYY